MEGGGEVADETALNGGLDGERAFCGEEISEVLEVFFAVGDVFEVVDEGRAVLVVALVLLFEGSDEVGFGLEVLVELIRVDLGESFDGFFADEEEVLLVGDHILDGFVAFLLLVEDAALIDVDASFDLFQFSNGFNLADEVSIFHKLPLPVCVKLGDLDLSNHEEVRVSSHPKDRVLESQHFVVEIEIGSVFSLNVCAQFKLPCVDVVNHMVFILAAVEFLDSLTNRERKFFKGCLLLQRKTFVVLVFMDGESIRLIHDNFKRLFEESLTASFSINTQRLVDQILVHDFLLLWIQIFVTQDLNFALLESIFVLIPKNFSQPILLKNFHVKLISLLVVRVINLNLDIPS